jgi:hypothetical protein
MELIKLSQTLEPIYKGKHLSGSRTNKTLVTEVLPLSPENRNSNLMTLWGWWLYFNLGGGGILV